MGQAEPEPQAEESADAAEGPRFPDTGADTAGRTAGPPAPAVWLYVAVAIFTAASLGIWRALALGADGVAAAGLILSAVTLVSSGLLGSGLVWRNRRPPQITSKDVLKVVGATTALVLLFGFLGQWYYATRPADVTKSFSWSTRHVEQRNQDAAAMKTLLYVPRELNRLSLRVLLVDDLPGAGECRGAVFQAERLGDDQPTKRESSGDTVNIKLPAHVRRVEIDLFLTVPRGCQMSGRVEKAVLSHE